MSGSKRIVIIEPSMNILVNNTFKVLQKSHINIENVGHISCFLILVLVNLSIQRPLYNQLKVCFTDTITVYIFIQLLWKNK